MRQHSLYLLFLNLLSLSRSVKVSFSLFKRWLSQKNCVAGTFRSRTSRRLLIPDDVLFHDIGFLMLWSTTVIFRKK
jgi:hypothetical protein